VLDPWIDPLDVKVLGLNYSLTLAALAVTKRKVPASPYAVRNKKPYSGITRFGESTLGGLSIDGDYIYPPLQPDVSA